jgi:hypothetical protein
MLSECFFFTAGAGGIFLNEFKILKNITTNTTVKKLADQSLEIANATKKVAIINNK